MSADDAGELVEVDITAALFGLAARWFAGTVRLIEADRWEAPGLGEWTVRELVGHTLRAFTTIEDYLVRPPEADHLAVDLDDAAEYFQVGLATPGIDAAVADRGREAGVALGDEPVATVEATVDRVLALLDDLPDGCVARTGFGTMLIEDYLDTRVTELVLHTLDLRAALGLPLDPPGGPARVALHVLADTMGRDDRGPALLALAGRRPLPAGFTALRSGG